MAGHLGLRHQNTGYHNPQISVHSACLEKNQDITHAGGPTLKPCLKTYPYPQGAQGPGGPRGLSQALKKRKKHTPAVLVPFLPHGSPRIKNSDAGEGIRRKWGVTRAGRARSVAFDVDPNVPNFF